LIYLLWILYKLTTINIVLNNMEVPNVSQEIVHVVSDKAIQEKAQDVAQEVSQVAIQEKAQDVAQDVAQNVAQVAIQEKAQDVAQDVAQNVAQDVAQNVAQDVAQNVAQDVAQNVAQEKAQEKIILNWGGMRPFAGAVFQYIQKLSQSVDFAKTHLQKNSEHTFAKVFLPLFDILQVPCTDQFGTLYVKQYLFHDAHYGPISHNGQLQKNRDNDPLNINMWHNFRNRFQYIWVLLNDSMDDCYKFKQPGGDGRGFGNTPCSIFRDFQVELLKENLYLVDYSDVVFDAKKNNYKYNIDIRLYRTPPTRRLYKVWHEYDLIPGINRV
jgi:hypothetical protein